MSKKMSVMRLPRCKEGPQTKKRPTLQVHGVHRFNPNRSLGLVVFRSFRRMNFDCLLMSDSKLLRIKNEQKGIL